MTLRKHKYKQQLADLRDYLKAAYGKAVDDQDATDDKEDYLYCEGRKRAFGEVLEKLTIEEVKAQAVDEHTRAGRNARKKERQRQRDDRTVWCTECLWSGPVLETYSSELAFQRCPGCLSTVVFKWGSGPNDRG